MKSKEPQESRIGPVNPFAMGDVFITAAKKLGWMEEEQVERQRRFFITTKGFTEMEKLGMDLQRVVHYRPMTPRPDNLPSRHERPIPGNESVPARHLRPLPQRETPFRPMRPGGRADNNSSRHGGPMSRHENNRPQHQRPYRPERPHDRQPPRQHDRNRP